MALLGLSQSYKITELELKGTSRDQRVQPPCKEGSLQQATQVGIQTGLEYLQRKRVHSQTAHPSALSLSHRGISSLCCMELPVLQFLPIAPCSICTLLKRIWTHPLVSCTLDIYKQ